MSAIHIHAPASYPAKTVTWCNSCGWRKRAVVEYYEWYDPSVTCCTCGHHPRDRAKKRIYKRGAERAKSLWLKAKTHKKAITDLCNNITKELSDDQRGNQPRRRTGGH